jgi:Holliday junction resolvase RusA-like endonuclease
MSDVNVSHFLEGKVHAQKRPRFYRNRVINPNKKSQDEVKVRIAEIVTSPMNGALHIEFDIRMKRPKKHYGRGGLKDTAPFFHTLKPDIDNIIKFYMDAFNGVLYDDDKQVASIGARKIYASHPGVFFEVTCLDSAQKDVPIK